MMTPMADFRAVVVVIAKMIESILDVHIVNFNLMV